MHCALAHFGPVTAANATGVGYPAANHRRTLPIRLRRTREYETSFRGKMAQSQYLVGNSREFNQCTLSGYTFCEGEHVVRPGW